AAAEKSADQLLAGRTDFIAVVPGARWATKRWPMARYVELVRKLLAAGETVVLIGSPDEKPLCDAIAQGAGISAGGSKSGAIINLGGRTLVAVMAALLSRAKLVIGNDSGPLHVAVALGKQVVGLYGPTPPEFVGPYGQLQNVLRHDVECHPCRRKTCDHHSCMNGLKVELVWEKTTKSISSISSNSPRAGL
ncbi:MAG TPA: glycosyltransferase family 9 protein, partial [Phycisphaerae bacterium]